MASMRLGAPAMAASRRVLLLDRLALLLGAVGEHAIEDGVEGVADDAQLGQAPLVEDGDGGAVGDGLLDGVGVDVRPERLAGSTGPSCRSACP